MSVVTTRAQKRSLSRETSNANNTNKASPDNKRTATTTTAAKAMPKQPEQRIAALEHSVTEMQTAYKQQQQTIEKLENINKQQQQQIIELQQQLSSYTPTNSEDFIELQIRQKHSIEGEIQQREDKKNNVVIMGFDKDDGTVLGREARTDENNNNDLKRLRASLRDMNEKMETGLQPDDIKAAFRMGKIQQQQQGKTYVRPLKVMLSNADAKLGLMRNGREGVLNTGAFIRADLTLMQRGQRAKAKVTLDAVRARAPDRKFVLRDANDGSVKIYERVTVQGGRTKINYMLDPLICNSNNLEDILTKVLS